MPKTLLLADDSVVIQKLVGLSFANEDIELVTTDNGDDALRRTRELRPDLVLADVVMPGKNGYEVCEAIKRNPETSHIPVLLLTGTFEAFDENRARQVGSNGHITKPFEAQGLVDRVTDLLSQAPAAPAPQPSATRPAAKPAAAPAASNDDAYDFFDDDLDQDLGEPRRPAARPAAPASDDAFAFGSDLDSLDGDTTDPDTLDTSFELDSEDAGDMTVAVAADAMPAPPRPPSAPAPPVGPRPATSPDRRAPDATQVVLGETMIADALNAPRPAPVASLDEGLAPAPHAVDLEAPTIPPAAPARPPRAPADDLFSDTPPPAPQRAPAAPRVAPPPVRPAPAQTTDSAFAFGSESPRPAPAPAAAPKPPPLPRPAPDVSLDTTDELDPLADMSPEPPAFAPPMLEPARQAPVLADAADSTHSGYDVSMSDLGDPLAGTSPPAPARPSPAPARAADPGISRPEPMVAPRSGAPDLSPVMRERIHETLEKVAWEAFADVSDSIVRQVLQRVESIVWEVVPQMAEALIQEEIRRMKGEE